MKLQEHGFTIYEIEDIKEKFLPLMEEEKVIVDMENVKKIDMSAIQLLISLKKSCEQSKKEFQILNVDDEILNSFEISGTAYILGV